MRVIGLGQSAAGDDGVGLEVVRRLRKDSRAASVPGLEIIEVADATLLIDALATPKPAIIVDAMLADTPGRVVMLGMDDLGSADTSLVSSHGMSVTQGIELAQVLLGEAFCTDLTVLGITIDRPAQYSEGLSPVVLAAAESAVEELWTWIGAKSHA